MNNTHHHPEHPLPAEIRDMARDDTVCQFCGVSYLIHNEIKSLQEQLEAYKNEVERLKCSDEREKRLNQQVALLTVKSDDLLEKWQVEVKRSNEHEELILQKNEFISQLKSSVENYTEDLASEKNKTEKLEHQLKDVSGVVVKVAATFKDLREEFSNICTSYRNDFVKFTLSWNEEKSLIFQNVAHLVKLYNACEEKNKQLQRDLEFRTVDHKRKMKNAETKNEKQRSVLEHCFKRLLEYKRKIESYDAELGKFQGKYSTTIGNYSKVIAKLNEKVHMLRTGVASVINHRNNDEKSLTSSIEKYKQQSVCLNEERSRMVNAHQHQLKQLHDSFMEKLSDAEKWPTKLDEKVKELEEKFKEEKRILEKNHEESLKKAADGHADEYKLINKNKEKYKQEVRKLEEKLNSQQRKFNEEKSQLLKQVTESYEKAARETEARYAEMNEERGKHLKLIRKLEQQLESMQVKFHGEMLKQVEQHEKEKRGTVALFEKKLFELTAQLDEEKHSKRNISSKEVEELIQRIRELERALTNAKDNINEKTKFIAENKNEINSLRDCVRLECEERFELTESLADARTELLALQRFGNSPKKLASHPLIYNNNQSSTNKQMETKPQHGRGTIKLEEISKSCGNFDGSKTNRDSPPVSVKSPSSTGRTSLPHYSKNKLRISLKNN